ncbi:MAG: PEP-CTERM sorting domain-containing protein [Holophagales bacterium]|nr:PEP-CTERM sorting domain-containing protein [Holophagales bacterium]MBK9964699.1 PEP-CTERM sorting domain-containing protein [Holophagales bacterium]
MTSPAHPTAVSASVLTFEGLANQEPLGDFYNGGTGGTGSGPGPNLGITFSSNALGIIDADAGGTGNFGGEPSPSTIMFFLTGAAATMNVPAGFAEGFSFYYSAINSTGVVTVYDGLNATGTVLATLALPLTPSNGAPDPTGNFSPLVPLGVTFSGTARSVDFGGAQNQIGFDDITIGSATPGQPSLSIVPTLSFWAMGVLALALAAGGYLVTKRLV